MSKLSVPCGVRGCSNPAPWIPLIGYQSSQGYRLAQVDYPLCTAHKQVMKINDILSGEAWAQMREELRRAGQSIPDFSRLELDFEHRVKGIYH
jgi:hypothetical protein